MRHHVQLGLTLSTTCSWGAGWALQQRHWPVVRLPSCGPLLRPLAAHPGPTPHPHPPCCRTRTRAAWTRGSGRRSTRRRWPRSLRSRRRQRCVGIRPDPRRQGLPTDCAHPTLRLLVSTAREWIESCSWRGCAEEFPHSFHTFNSSISPGDFPYSSIASFASYSPKL